MRTFLLCCALLLSLLIPPTCVTARIADDVIERDGRGIILLAEPFGFGSEGHLNLTVSNLELHRSNVDTNLQGFFITSSQAEAQLELDLSQGTCALLADTVVKVLTLKQVEENAQAGRNSTNINEAMAKLVPSYAGGEWSLFFANCQKPSVVSFDVRVEMYNMHNGQKDYLSIGEDMIPAVYLAAFVLFLVAGIMWCSAVVVARKNAHRIHLFMILLVFFKALTLLTQFGMFHLIRTTGHPDGWNIAFYFFTFMRGVLFFTVVILIGTGWSYMKPLLSDNEKKILLAVIPLQVFAEVAIIILDENSPATRNWFTWRDVFHVVDIICCCAILFPIVWSIQHLKEAAETDGKAARNLVKMRLFRQFYVLVVSYIYFTRIVVYLLRSTMSYKYVWLSDAAGELATLLFYVLTALKFRPHADNPYFAVATEDAEV
ncbi:hypothetical protein ABBQ38_009211 [Trebouxia sp. C0009 RCD-2024]